MPQVTPPDGWQLAGIFVGGCVERGDGSSFRRKAHAHTARNDAYRGWVCFRSPKRLWTPSGKPSRLLLHEYAHVLQPSAGHGPAWQKRVSALGAPSEARQVVNINARFRARRAARQ